MDENVRNNKTVSDIIRELMEVKHKQLITIKALEISQQQSQRIIESLQANKNNLLATNSSLRCKFANALQDVNIQKEQIQHITRFEGNYKQYEKAMDVTRGQALNDANAQIVKLSDQLHQQSTEHSSHIYDLEERNRQMATDLICYQEQNKSLNDQLAQRTVLYSSLERIYREEGNVNYRTTSTQHQQITDLTQQIKILTMELQACRDENKEYALHIEQNTRELTLSRQLLTQYEVQIVELEERNILLSNLNNELQSNIDHLKGSNYDDFQEQQLNELKIQYATIKHENTELTQRLITVLEKIKQYELVQQVDSPARRREGRDGRSNNNNEMIRYSMENASHASHLTEVQDYDSSVNMSKINSHQRANNSHNSNNSKNSKQSNAGHSQSQAQRQRNNNNNSGIAMRYTNSINNSNNSSYHHTEQDSLNNAEEGEDVSIISSIYPNSIQEYTHYPHTNTHMHDIHNAISNNNHHQNLSITDQNMDQILSDNDQSEVDGVSFLGVPSPYKNVHDRVEIIENKLRHSRDSVGVTVHSSSGGHSSSNKRNRNNSSNSNDEQYIRHQQSQQQQQQQQQWQEQQEQHQLHDQHEQQSYEEHQQQQQHEEEEEEMVSMSVYIELQALYEAKMIEFDDLLSAYKQLRIEEKQYKTKNEQLTTELNTLKLEYSTLQALHTQQIDTLTSTQVELQTATLQHEGDTMKIVDLTQQIEHYTHNKDSLRSVISNLQLEISSKVEQITTYTHCEVAHTETIQQLEHKIEQDRLQLEAIAVKFNQIKAKCKEKTLHYRDKYTHLHHSLEAYQYSMNQLVDEKVHEIESRFSDQLLHLKVQVHDLTERYQLLMHHQ